MPKSKERSAVTKNNLEEHHPMGSMTATEGTEGGQGSRRTGGQTFSPAAEKAIVRWLEKLDELGFVVKLAKDVQNRQVQMQEDHKNVMVRNWATRFLDRHDSLAAQFASRLDHQQAPASDPDTLPPARQAHKSR
ncbi:hypothetical protein FN846DRAFT_907120 [Sphaerosporella brunnea]|uniref:HTH CENPB-type domain-containing protein n=1 Tax=Sphaerosporella brunnea TaxID=1250544 RepID=A0A5J5EX52_9PEZI|nr:hypothetical protein FN846DRAFT_907120 [Sphaerosporella brunnea]